VLLLQELGPTLRRLRPSNDLGLLQEIWANAHGTRESLYSISGSVVIAENLGVHAKLIYKYQILYLDHKR